MSNLALAARVRLPPLPTIREIIRMYKLRAMKELSQNFLLEQRLTDKIVKTAGDLAGGHVCEVGPGPGGITRSIIRRNPAEVTVVELDKRFFTSLEMIGEAVNKELKFNIIHGDILRTNLENVFANSDKRAWDDVPPNNHIIGNLPFNISTILIIRWLQAISEKSSAWVNGRTRMTLTFQKEIAERIVAPIVSPQRCRLSVMCQNWCKVEHRFNIPGKAFLPKPDVDVGIVTFTPLKQPLIPLDFKLIEKFLRNIFHMRQKYSLRGVENLFPMHMRELSLKVFEIADLDPRTRSYQITNMEFNRLIYAYKQVLDEHPEVADYNFRSKRRIYNKENLPSDFTEDKYECIV